MKRVLGFKTYKWTCASCKKHFITLPIMQGLGDDNCECGNTSFKFSKGRPIGRKSRQWDTWYELYQSIKECTPKEFLGAIYDNNR